MNKTTTAIVIGILVLLGGYLLLGKDKTQTSTEPAISPIEINSLDEAATESAKSIESSENMVVIESGNFFFNPSTANAQSGTVNVSITENTGFHTFVIDELGVKKQLASGMGFSFNAEPGTYEYYCDVPGHKEQGMLGTIIIN